MKGAKFMSRDITEQIDDVCMENYGHTDWAILDEMSWQERLHQKYEIKTFFNRQVAFFHKQRLKEQD